MGYAKNYGARRFNAGSREMILYRQRDEKRVPRCACGCGAALVKGDIEFHHVIQWELSHDSRPSNGTALTTDCHRKRYPLDAKVIAKVRRQRKRFAGARKTPRHPMPCGRRSKWSKPVGAIAPVPRTTLADKHAATMRKRAILTHAEA